MIYKPTFGFKETTVHYVLRPSCYAVIFNETFSKVAIIKNRNRFFLPGGGMEGTETQEACLHREHFRFIILVSLQSTMIILIQFNFYLIIPFMYFIEKGSVLLFRNSHLVIKNLLFSMYYDLVAMRLFLMIVVQKLLSSKKENVSFYQVVVWKVRKRKKHVYIVNY